MSSVLKALRNQSSPLLQERQPIWLTAAESGRRRHWHWLAIILAVIAAGGIGWLIAAQQSAQVVDPIVAPQPTGSRYTLGAIPEIRQPVLPEPVAEAIAVPAAAQPAESEATAQPQAIDLNEVSPELLKAFEDAVAATGGAGSPGDSVVPDLQQLSLDFQRTVPPFTYDGHQYSSRESSRWVVLGGRRLYEGDSWQGMTVVRIAPAHLVLSKNYQAFQHPALEDWTSP